MISPSRDKNKLQYLKPPPKFYVITKLGFFLIGASREPCQQMVLLKAALALPHLFPTSVFSCSSCFCQPPTDSLDWPLAEAYDKHNQLPIGKLQRLHLQREQSDPADSQRVISFIFCSCSQQRDTPPKINMSKRDHF